MKRFRAQPIDPLTGRRVSLSFDTRQELDRALAQHARIKAELKLGADPSALRARIARPVTVDAAWKRWRTTVGRASAATIDSQRRHLEPLARLDCRELNAHTLAAWWTELRSRVADNTAAGVWQHLAQAVRLAVRVGELQALPWGEWKPPRPPRAARMAPKRAACTSPEQLRALVEAASREGQDNGRALLFLALSGLRQGEACALAWNDVDLASGRILVQRQAGRGWWKRSSRPVDPPKGGTPRAQIAHPAALEALREQRAALEARGHFAPEGPVWPGRGGGWRRTSRLLQPGAVARWAAAAGLPAALPWVAHSMRHTCATLELAANGGDLRATAARTGHRDLEVLASYLHATHPPESAIAFEPMPARFAEALDPERASIEQRARDALQAAADLRASGGVVLRPEAQARDDGRKAYARARIRALRAGATPEEAARAGARARRAKLANIARAAKRVR